MIKSDLPRRRGRKPTVKFPVQITMVESGLAREKVLEAGARLSCRWCGSIFRADESTLYLSEIAIDDTPIVRCPCCWHCASVLYYFDRIVTDGGQPVRRRRRTPEDIGPAEAYDTPEG